MDISISGGKYSALDNCCCAEFSAYYTADNKPGHSSEDQLDEIQDKSIAENHEERGYPPPPSPPKKKLG